MKTITINITHDEVFEDMVKDFENDVNSKFAEVTITNDNVVMNITGTLEELDSE